MPRSGRLLVAAEVSLALVTLSAIAGMGRLFAGHDWVVPLLANAVVAHLAVTLLRRRGVPLIPTAAVMVVGAVVLATWATHLGETVAGLPGPGALGLVVEDLQDAIPLFQEVKPPAPVAPGFLIATIFAVWAIAYVADWAAFRLWVPFEATLPAATLFLFASLLQLTDQGRVLAATLYVGAVLLFLLQHRLAREDATGHWINARGAAGRRALEVSGLALATGAVLVGVVLAPMAPGTDVPGLIDTRELGRTGGGRVTVSPLVDIRSRLVQQSDEEVFSVRANERAYWRLTALDEFDGQLWTSNAEYPDADEVLPQAEELDVPVREVRQEFIIQTLAQIWLPAAYRPVRLESEGSVRYDKESSTLIVGDDAETSDARAYEVSSSSARFTAPELDRLPAGGPEDLVEHYTRLPEDFPPSVTALARDLTEGVTSPAGKARALQDHLRTFEYSTQVPAGQGNDDIEEFLFDEQRGYCEQFAGSFAAMARAVGLPARVAVGFTPGDQDPTDPTLFHVKGVHAHAWPEVYLDGAGWVAYEPTPGRGMPGAEPYTGVPEDQATGQVGITTTTAPTTTELTIPQTPATAPIEEEPELETADPVAPPPSTLERIGSGLARVLLVALGLGLVYAAVVPALLALQRWQRRRAATSPMERIDLAWTEAVEHAALVGYRERRSDTFPERAAALGERLPEAAEAAVAVATGVELAAYTEQGATAAEAAAVEEAAAEVRAVAWAATPWKPRLRRWLDPRPALRQRRADRHVARRVTQSATGDLEQERELVDVGPTIDAG